MYKQGALYAVLISIVLLVNIAGASIPQLISVQGRLTDASGTPLTGDNNLTFLIYNSSSGGGSLWTEYHDGTNNVTVTNGVFNVLLGSVTALNLPFNESYWLEVVVNGETQSPRINFTTSAYAFRANKSEGLDCTGCINDTHISSSANISPDKIFGTAWTSANDGPGSGLDADTIDGSHKGTGDDDVITGATADSKISTNISAHDASQTSHPYILSNAEKTVLLDRLDFANWDFNGSGSAGPIDFDCTTILSPDASKAKYVIVHLEVESGISSTTTGQSAAMDLRVQKKGATNWAGRAHATSTITSTTGTGASDQSDDTQIVICEMDASKTITWQAILTAATGSGHGYYYGMVVGYIETLA